MKAAIIAASAVATVAIGATVWYQKFASPADRSNTKAAVNILTGIKLPGYYESDQPK